eukprot:19760_1
MYGYDYGCAVKLTDSGVKLYADTTRYRNGSQRWILNMMSLISNIDNNLHDICGPSFVWKKLGVLIYVVDNKCIIGSDCQQKIEEKSYWSQKFINTYIVFDNKLKSKCQRSVCDRKYTFADQPQIYNFY